MIDGTTLTVLQAQVRRTGRSLLQYVDESFPWARGRDVEIVEQLKNMADKERQAAAAIVRFLMQKRCGTPYMGQFPEYFTTFNFLAVKRLLRLLVQHQQQDITALETDLPTVKEPQARQLLRDLLECKTQHLEACQELAKPDTKPVEQGTPT